MITGYYLRVKRGEKFESLDISELTEGEIRATFKDKTQADLLGWVVSLAKFIGEVQPIHQQVEREV